MQNNVSFAFKIRRNYTPTSIIVILNYLFNMSTKIVLKFKFQKRNDEIYEILCGIFFFSVAAPLYNVILT